MERTYWCKFKFFRTIVLLQIVLGGFVILASLLSLHKFYSVSFFINQKDACNKFSTMKEGYADFDMKALSERVEEILNKLASLQDKLDSDVQKMDKNKELRDQNITGAEFRRFLDEEVIQPLYGAHVGLRLIRIPKVGKAGSISPKEDPLINFFTMEETRKYITGKEKRMGMISVYGTNKTYNTIGHACVMMRNELEEYMNYDIGSSCKDDWNLAQKLMVGGCDPVPRRRCLTRASKLYRKPFPINESMWRIPDNGNVRWSNYQCKNFNCLSERNLKRGFSKCTSCFELEKEKLKWVTNSSLRANFLMDDVLAVKPGEIRIGLDVSVGTGTFAARMKERNVTVMSTALNIGAPFSEMIALRGMIPLYITLNQRLPFFDNTMDLIHTSEFLNGWIDLQLMDFILYDWDRVLRPGGLLWVDKFFCSRKDLDDYMYMFLQFSYRKHKWVLSQKSNDDVYLSALLEKPPR